MSKLLVLGGSHSDLPLIESAVLYGHEVHSTGNQADHPGHRISHSYIPGDFSEPDEMLEIGRKLEIDYIVPGANDFAMMSAAYVAEQMQLSGYDSFATTTLLHRKDKFKAFAESIDMPVCRHISFSPTDSEKVCDSVKGLTFPLIMKPVDLTGGKGITRVDSERDLVGALNEALRMSRQKSVVIEEWFFGDLYSYSTIIQNGEIIFDYFDTELCLYQEYLVSTSLSICSITSDAKEMLRSSTRRMVKELNLVDGVLHCQFLASDEGVRIIEYTRRMSGDLYSKVVQLVCGFRHQDVFIASATGGGILPLLNRAKNIGRPFVSRHCITADKSGRFVRLNIDQKILQKIVSITPVLPFGSIVSGDGRSKVAVVILSFDDEFDMKNFAVNCKSTLKCEVMPC